MIKNVEKELNKMKVESLGDVGVKLTRIMEERDAAIQFIDRNKKILMRLNKLILVNRKVKAADLIKIKEKVEKKLELKSEEAVELDNKLKYWVHNLIIQREAMGITDHSRLKDFYN